MAENEVLTSTGVAPTGVADQISTRGAPQSRHALIALFAALTPLDSSFLALEMSLFELWTSPTSEADQSVGLGSAGQGRPYY